MVVIFLLVFFLLKFFLIFKKLKKIFFFFNLAALGLNCCTQYLVPRPGIEPEPPTLRAQSLNHRITREVPVVVGWLVGCVF